MNVLLITEPGIDGVFRYVEALAHFLIDRDHRVHLAYSDRRAGEALAQLIDHVHEHNGITVNLEVGPGPSPRSDWRALRRLRTMVRLVQPDVIHSHSSKAGALARALPFVGVRLPQVYHPHAYAGMRPQSAAMRLLYDGIEAVLGRVSITVNCSEDELDYARDRLHVPVVRTLYVPNGVDTRRFAPPTPAQRHAARNRFGLPPDALILGTVGRTAPQKDPLTLYHAFARAHEAEPNLMLFHLGTGELDGQLHDFVRRRGLQGAIVRRAYLADPVDFYRAVDGFILPSLYEGLALSVLEAMACNLPLILSEGPGNRSLLKLPFSHLWSAPPGDILGFARGIASWAESRRAWARPQTPNHRLIALESFDSRVNLARVLSLYQQLHGRATAQPAGRRTTWRSAPGLPAAPSHLLPAESPRELRVDR